MPSALDQFRTQQGGITPEADPYGPRGLAGRAVTSTSTSVTGGTPVPKPTPTTAPPTGGTTPPPPVTTGPTPMPKPTGTPPTGTVPNPTGPSNPSLINPGWRPTTAPAGGTGTNGPSDQPGTGQPGVAPPGGGGGAGIINPGPPSSFSPYNVVTDNINNLLSSNSRYIQNARQRGVEQAAGRGLLNSSISAGASERAAIEGAMPIMSQIMGLTSQRESQAFQQQFAQTQATLQDWAADRQFNREFNAQLSLIPIASSADMWGSLMQAAMQDPTTFTPTVISGYQDFFQNGFNEYVGRYFEGIDFGPGGD